MTSVQIYCCIFFACFCYSVVKGLAMNEHSTISKEEMKSMKTVLRREFLIQSRNSSSTDGKYSMDIKANVTNSRVKRQSGGGAGKFVEAAKMPQIKLLRLLLQMFKNMWDASYVGGTHPLHPNVPKTIAALYKEKVVEFFIPDVGEDPNKPTSK